MNQGRNLSSDASLMPSRPETQIDSESHGWNMASAKSHGRNRAADTSQSPSQSDTQVVVENRCRHLAAESSRETSPTASPSVVEAETPLSTAESSSTAASHLQIFSSTRHNHQRRLKANWRTQQLQRSKSYRISPEPLRHKKQLSHSSQTLPRMHKLSRSWDQHTAAR